MALIFIAIFSLITGVLGLSILIKLSLTCCPPERNAVVDFESLKIGYLNITETGLILPQIPTIVLGFSSIIFIMFMVLGIILLITNMMDASDAVIVFVWGTVLNVVLSFVTVNLAYYECFFNEFSMCILNGIDWFSVGFIYIGLMTKLAVWMYFAAVANTYRELGS